MRNYSVQKMFLKFLQNLSKNILDAAVYTMQGTQTLCLNALKKLKKKKLEKNWVARSN